MKEMKRILSLVLCLVMLVGLIPASALTAFAAGEETTYVLAGSDFQADSHTASAANVSSILQQIKQTYGTMDGFLFAGDYDVDDINAWNNDSADGKAKLQETVQGVYGTDMDEVYVQGNHDGDDLVGSTLATSGDHDAEDYGVFVINEKDYMWYNNDESTIQDTASNLEYYLNAKLNDKYSKPIFVVSHLPLHYSMRTLKGGGDGQYANYIFDVLNKAGNAGLNIIYLCGHDHSHGWDDYLGGAAIFLKEGDKINIAQSSTTVYKEETLHFTYMNAGYVGYYGDTGSDADTTLTMTTFAITDSNVTISRYDSNGKHVLKAKGVYGGEYPDNRYATPVYAPDTDEVDSSYTLTLKQFEPDPTVEDKTTGVSVSAPGVTAVTVKVKDVEVPAGYSAYASYDITLEGYTQGDIATVTIAVPKGFDMSKPAVVLDQGVQIAKDTDLSDGITFTTNHFSEYDVAQVDEVAGVTASGNLVSDTTVDTNSSAPQAGNYYLIRPVRDGNGTLTNVSTKVNNSTGLDVVDTGLNAQDNNVWYYDGTHIILRSTGEYLSVGSAQDAAALIDDANATNLVNSVYENTNYRGTYTLAATQNATYKYLNRAGSGSFAGAWSSDGNGDEGSRWYFYKVTFGSGDPVTLTVTPASKTVTNGKTASLTASVLVNNKAATSKTITWSSSDTTVATVDANGVVTGVKDGTATITATLTKANGENVNGTVAVEIPVTVKTRTATSITVDPMTGSVQRGTQSTAKTGSTMTVTYDNGDVEYNVPVTVSMLTNADGSAVSTSKTGTYENLTVTYEDQTATGYTLNVLPKVGNNYPEYPNEGAVKVGKTGTGIDFQSSGIAQVEISASGVPMKKGADVIVMLDLSSSMKDNTINDNGTTKTRVRVLEESLESLLKQLQANGEDGEPMDIRIAVADFNRYYTNTDSPYYINPNDHATGAETRNNTGNANQVYTGDKSIGTGAFVDVHSLETNEFYNLPTQSGTNYDYAFDVAYQLGEAITAENATKGEDRDLFVIFMSDGCPYQYNYFGSGSEGTGATYWNNWLQGTMTDTMFAAGSNKSYYNPEGKHWMAEAIKGDPDTTYPVIRKNNAADTDKDNWVDVYGLGAKMYSIGFCLADDKDVKYASMDHVIRGIASEEKYYFTANTASALNNAFTAIGHDIAYAAYNARFVDQMGAKYDLQMKTSTYTVVENGATAEKTLAPKIEIISYDIYTRQDYLDKKITADKIGDRKGTYTVLETVTFNADGTEAYSSLNSVGPDGNTITAGSNILLDGVIYANTFWYNTKSTPVTVEGVDIPTGKDSANLTTGSTNELPSETFYWKMGTVQTSELAMRYYVYLTGSMEGTREAGSYPTNEYATLYYDNYLENPCYKETVSPVLAWKSANVSYAFYLVNEKGEIIVNQTTGQTGTFANKIAVTNPVVYEEILLNNLDEISSIEVASNEKGILPVGYELYDSASVYTIKINSNSTGSWRIAKGADTVASTYVTQFDTTDAAAYSNDLLNGVDEDGNTVVTGNDYTHTVVWFAVLWKVQALPDTVVIDYGLPVDISVLANDMFGENGKLAGVGAFSDNLNLDGHEVSLATGFDEEYTGTYGSAKADTAIGKVRYTPANMQMNGYEKFAYAVNYTGNENAGYYYDTVTVIPATTIYYEDDFLTYSGNWVDEGTAISDATQAEDRPGQYSLTDANNIYGYDGINLGTSTFSLGTAKKVHVDANSYATAEFTFYGTGFDIISMTSNTTGVLTVKVTAAEDIMVDGIVKYAKDVKVKSTVVDTYYGYNYGLYEVTYTYNDASGTWTSVVGSEITDEDATEKKTTVPENPYNGQTYTNKEYRWVCEPDVNKAMYQVPVLQANDLPYGKYNVTLTATYLAGMDDTTAEGYDLYLDAIRIYDPANDGAEDDDTVIEDAYKADGEGWPSYIELRNQLIDANTLGNASTTTKITGLVFIDGDDEVGDAQITDYISYGPNNEVYLAPGQSVAFILSTPANIANVHIGIKSADGKPGTYTITNIAKQDIVDGNTTKVKAGDDYNAKTYTVSTTTDMYYDLTGWKGDIIVITNTGDMYNTTGVISLTNIKSTYTSDPAADNDVAPASEGQTYAVMTAADEEVTSESMETYIYMTPAAATLTLRSLNSAAEEEVPEETEPETTVPEETEPETTVPEETEPETSEPGSGEGSANNSIIGTIIKIVLGWLFG